MLVIMELRDSLQSQRDIPTVVSRGCHEAQAENDRNGRSRNPKVCHSVHISHAQNARGLPSVSVHRAIASPQPLRPLELVVF